MVASGDLTSAASGSSQTTVASCGKLVLSAQTPGSPRAMFGVESARGRLVLDEHELRGTAPRSFPAPTESAQQPPTPPPGHGTVLARKCMEQCSPRARLLVSFFLCSNVPIINVCVLRPPQWHGAWPGATHAQLHRRLVLPIHVDGPRLHAHGRIRVALFSLSLQFYVVDPVVIHKNEKMH
jgi:hypothetical protein